MWSLKVKSEGLGIPSNYKKLQGMSICIENLYVNQHKIRDKHNKLHSIIIHNNSYINGMMQHLVNINKWNDLQSSLRCDIETITYMHRIRRIIKSFEGQN
nr:hypothetical protein [Rhizoctonia sp.]